MILNPRWILVLAGLTLLCDAAFAFDLPEKTQGKTATGMGTIQVAFAPDDDTADIIEKVINAARTQVLVQAYSFTSRQLAGALVHAKKHGVDVQLIADREQTEKLPYNMIASIAASGVATYIDSQHQSAHNKVMIIDATSAAPVVITGSYNFTRAAEIKNAENVLIIRGNKALAEAYLKNWQQHRAHSHPFRAP